MWTMWGGKPKIFQVTKCTGIPRQLVYAIKRLVRVCFKKFFKALILEKLLLDTDLQIKFHNLTILLKHEAWNAYVLQK